MIFLGPFPTDSDGDMDRGGGGEKDAKREGKTKRGKRERAESLGKMASSPHKVVRELNINRKFVMAKPARRTFWQVVMGQTDFI